MSQAKLGDRVKIHYTERLENGEVLNTSEGSQPLEITIGKNLVPVLEKAVKGMETGQTKTFRVQPKEAHGSRHREMMIVVKKSDLPQSITPSIGQHMKVRKPDGSFIDAVITKIKRDTIEFDTNHPLAGKTLIFDITLVEIA